MKWLEYVQKMTFLVWVLIKIQHQSPFRDNYTIQITFLSWKRKGRGDQNIRRVLFLKSVHNIEEFIRVILIISFRKPLDKFVWSHFFNHSMAIQIEGEEWTCEMNGIRRRSHMKMYNAQVPHRSLYLFKFSNFDLKIL